MKRYYDPEYDRIVEETEVRRQYDWFSKQKWFTKSYEDFTLDNFQEVQRYRIDFMQNDEVVATTYRYGRTQTEALRFALTDVHNNKGHIGFGWFTSEFDFDLKVTPDEDTYFIYYPEDCEGDDSYSTPFFDHKKVRNIRNEFGGSIHDTLGNDVTFTI